jgi:hypothetical protein
MSARVEEPDFLTGLGVDTRKIGPFMVVVRPTVTVPPLLQRAILTEDGGHDHFTGLLSDV